ncbi:MAG TPA: hypothetical protein VL947_01460, partial [Cytophagales bacterium]|nr:hypothetical protein [Cytophagales bacterium]
MQIFTVIFSLFFIIITFIPLIKTGVWWIRIFDYPRMQIAFFVLGGIALSLVYLQWSHFPDILLLVGLLGAFVYQLILIIKYTPFYPIQAK